MPAVAPGAKILVSGANGFIAVWAVRYLLEHGFAVRGTVRSAAKGAHLARLFAAHGAKFEIVVVPDITLPGAFDEAVKGVDAIEHTASPFHMDADDPDELIIPAVKGTVGILESALKNAPGLQRVVVLSSCAAVSNPSDSGVLNESNWNTENEKEIAEKGRAASQSAKYRSSKALAERAAWDFVEKHKGEIKWDLVTLCPPFVFGPVLHEVSSPAELNTSVRDWYNAVLGGKKTPEQLAAIQGSWVDVRDLALAHVHAIERKQASGQRFILTAGNFTWQQWFDVVNALSLPNVNTPKGTPGASVKFVQIYDTSKARDVLGIQFRDKTTTARDSIQDYKERGW